MSNTGNLFLQTIQKWQEPKENEKNLETDITSFIAFFTGVFNRIPDQKSKEFILSELEKFEKQGNS